MFVATAADIVDSIRSVWLDRLVHWIGVLARALVSQTCCVDIEKAEE
jgi:hypothetical protein